MELGPLSNERYDIRFEKDRVLLRFHFESLQKAFWKDHFAKSTARSGDPVVRDSGGQDYAVTQFHESEGVALDFTLPDPRKKIPTIAFDPLQSADGSKGAPQRLIDDLEKWLEAWELESQSEA